MTDENDVVVDQEIDAMLRGGLLQSNQGVVLFRLHFLDDRLDKTVLGFGYYPEQLAGAEVPRGFEHADRAVQLIHGRCQQQVETVLETPMG